MFFFTGFTGSSVDSLNLEQILKKLFFSSYKVFVKSFKRSVIQSMYSCSLNLVRNITFLVTCNTNRIQRYSVLNIICSDYFALFYVKLNNKLYQALQFKKIYTFTYLANLVVCFKQKTFYLKNRGNVIWTHAFLLPKQTRYRCVIPRNQSEN